MIAASDNVSTALVLRTMGLDVMRSELAGVGLKHTRLIIPARPDAGPRGQGISTARELGTLLEGIARRTLATPAACDAMAAHLDCQLYGDQIARLLPHNLYAGDRDITSRLRVANKTGFTRGVRADAGIVSIDGTPTFVIVTLAADHPDHGYYPDHPANLMNAIAARLAVAHWQGEGALAALATAHAPLPPLPGTHAVAPVC